MKKVATNTKNSNKKTSTAKKGVQKKKKFNIKPFIFIGLAIAFVVMLVLIYKNLFSNSDGDRYEGINNYNLTKEEISAVTEKVKTLGDNVASVDVYVKSKIIRIFVKLKEDVNFKTVKEVSNQTIGLFSESNLEYFDLEIFFDTEKESDVYPKIGYKHKTRKEFSW